MPDVPDKELIDGLTIFLQISVEVRDGMVVERNCHTNIVQARCIALEILYCIDVGVEHVGVVHHFL